MHANGVGKQPAYQTVMARILIVEDEPAIMMLLRRVVTSMGHEVLPALHGDEALHLAESERVLDMIITDLTLPGQLSGVNLLRALRSAKPDVPVVVATGYSSEETLQICQELGITDFLAKPFEIAFVRTCVDTILKRHIQAIPH